MPENEEKPVTPEQKPMTLNEIKDFKQNYVEKSEYERLLAENANLSDYILTEKKTPMRTDGNVKPTDYNKPMLNIDYVTAMLADREAELAKSGFDVFTAKGSHQQVNGDKVASFLRDKLEQANGSNEVFCSLLTSGLIEPMSIKKAYN